MLKEDAIEPELGSAHAHIVGRGDLAPSGIDDRDRGLAGQNAFQHAADEGHGRGDNEHGGHGEPPMSTGMLESKTGDDLGAADHGNETVALLSIPGATNTDGGEKSNEARGETFPAVEVENPVPSKPALDGEIFRVAKLAKGERGGRIFDREGGSASGSGTGGAPACTAQFSVDEDVACVDEILVRTSCGTMLAWVLLLSLAYASAPPGAIRRYGGAELNAALVELSVLSTAVFMKHFPLLWEMKFGEARPLSAKERVAAGRSRVSGILVGEMVTQFIAIATVAIMACLPCPVMIDPVLGSRVHIVRWCEWIPLAGLMTLMTECIDAPNYDGDRMTHLWKEKFTVAGMETVSTLGGLLFPFCANIYVWSIVMVFSCITYSAIIFRYYKKKRLFQSCIWREGRSVDEVELYDRARLSLSLHGTCCVVWTLITVNYFVTSMGHLVVPASWALLHNPAAIMIGECIMDLIAKLVYMALIIEVHHAAFDETKRANRRLVELRNMMGVVWETSSDAIAISVRKVASGSVTSMVSPSFFRKALTRSQQLIIEDVSAIIFEHDKHSLEMAREPTVHLSKAGAGYKLPSVGMKVVRKADFASINFPSCVDELAFEYHGGKYDAMDLLVGAFTDMLASAWGSGKSGEFLFEHDATLQDGEARTKFEVGGTRLDRNSMVMVSRNVSERHKRFEAEKRFVFETTARKKDAEANRFTRHEVKNGLLAAIEICGNVREKLLVEGNLLKSSCHDSKAIYLTKRNENMEDLDRTLHEVLDIVLAETMSKDLIHEKYVPKLEFCDVNHILAHTRGFQANSGQFSVVCRPSPLPILLSDQGLIKCIHGNAIRNAIRYGAPGGKITTEAYYDANTGLFDMKIINLPGPGHEKLVSLGDRAGNIVFSHGTCLHKASDLGKRIASTGDGGWIMRKCANLLNGSVGINFQENRTIFTFQAPLRTVKDDSPKPVDTFHLPEGVWGIGIDDSKIQRKLLRRYFQHAGVHEDRQIVMGQSAEEITGFVSFFVDFVNQHPSDCILLIADENLETNSDISNHETVSGSECIKQIRKTLKPEQEQQILALVRSANDSPKDLAIYNSRAHGYLPKVPLKGGNVRETLAPIWEKRFPPDGVEKDDSGVEGRLTQNVSVENLRDLSLISPVELLSELEQIDSLCVQNNGNNDNDLWHVLWDKLHLLKGDLKSVDVDDKLSHTIDLIETLRGRSYPSNFMPVWIQIRSDVVSYVSPN